MSVVDDFIFECFARKSRKGYEENENISLIKSKLINEDWFNVNDS